MRTDSQNGAKYDTSFIGTEFTITYCVLKDSNESYNDSAVSVLFNFVNSLDTEGKPARSEAYVPNHFKGGTATSSGVGGIGTETDDDYDD